MTVEEQLADLQRQLNDSCTKIPADAFSAAYGVPAQYVEIPLHPYQSFGCTYQTPDGLHRFSFVFNSEAVHAKAYEQLSSMGLKVHSVPGFEMETLVVDRPNDPSLGAISVHGHGLWYQLFMTRVAQPTAWDDSGQTKVAPIKEGTPEQYQALAKVVVDVSPPEPVIR